MDRKKVLRIVLIVLLIAMYVLIFYFSSQEGSKSSKLSGGIVRKILYSLGIIDNMETYSIIEIIIRKLAHFSLYFISRLFIYVYTMYN